MPAPQSIKWFGIFRNRPFFGSSQKTVRAVKPSPFRATSAFSTKSKMLMRSLATISRRSEWSGMAKVLRTLPVLSRGNSAPKIFVCSAVLTRYSGIFWILFISLPPLLPDRACPPLILCLLYVMTILSLLLLGVAVREYYGYTKQTFVLRSGQYFPDG